MFRYVGHPLMGSAQSTLTLSQKEELRSVFRLCDADESGTLERWEVKRAIYKSGVCETEKEVRSCVRDIMHHTWTTRISEDQFIEYMAQRLLAAHNLQVELDRALVVVLRHCSVERLRTLSRLQQTAAARDILSLLLEVSPDKTVTRRHLQANYDISLPEPSPKGRTHASADSSALGSSALDSSSVASFRTLGLVSFAAKAMGSGSGGVNGSGGGIGSGSGIGHGIDGSSHGAKPKMTRMSRAQSMCSFGERSATLRALAGQPSAKRELRQASQGGGGGGPHSRLQAPEVPEDIRLELRRPTSVPSHVKLGRLSGYRAPPTDAAATNGEPRRGAAISSNVLTLPNSSLPIPSAALEGAGPPHDIPYHASRSSLSPKPPVAPPAIKVPATKPMGMGGGPAVDRLASHNREGQESPTVSMTRSFPSLARPASPHKKASAGGLASDDVSSLGNGRSGAEGAPKSGSAKEDEVAAASKPPPPTYEAKLYEATEKWRAAAVEPRATLSSKVSDKLSQTASAGSRVAGRALMRSASLGGKSLKRSTSLGANLGAGLAIDSVSIGVATTRELLTRAGVDVADVDSPSLLSRQLRGLSSQSGQSSQSEAEEAIAQAMASHKADRERAHEVARRALFLMSAQPLPSDAVLEDDEDDKDDEDADAEEDEEVSGVTAAARTAQAPAAARQEGRRSPLEVVRPSDPSSAPASELGTLRSQLADLERQRSAGTLQSATTTAALRCKSSFLRTVDRLALEDSIMDSRSRSERGGDGGGDGGGALPPTAAESASSRQRAELSRAEQTHRAEDEQQQREQQRAEQLAAARDEEEVDVELLRVFLLDAGYAAFDAEEVERLIAQADPERTGLVRFGQLRSLACFAIAEHGAQEAEDVDHDDTAPDNVPKVRGRPRQMVT